MVTTEHRINLNVYKRIIEKYGDFVVRTPVIDTVSNVDGDETRTDGTVETIRVYIVRKNRNWKFDSAGLIEGGDAQMLIQPDQTMNKHDKITWNSNTYRVEDVLNRDNVGGNCVYKSCNLFLI